MSSEYLICPICGAHKRQLRTHLIRSHKMTREEIHLEYPNMKMITDECSKLRSSSIKNAWDKNGDNLRESRRNMWQGEGKKDKLLRTMRSEEFKSRHSERMKEVLSSESARRNMRESQLRAFQDPERIRKNSEHMKRLHERGVFDKVRESEEYRVKLSEAAKASYQNSPRRRELVSEANRRRWRERSKTPNDMFVNRGLHTTKSTYNGISYRSGWEVKLAIILTKNDIRFEYETLSIPYTISGKRRTYVPDFLVGTDLILEVKPEEHISDITEAKRTACESLGYKFMYVTWSELSNPEELLMEVQRLSNDSST